MTVPVLSEDMESICLIDLYSFDVGENSEYRASADLLGFDGFVVELGDGREKDEDSTFPPPSSLLFFMFSRRFFASSLRRTPEGPSSMPKE